MRRGPRLAVWFLMLAGPVGATVGPWSENPHSKVRLVTPYAAAPRQGPFLFASEFELAPGWHAYWRNSGDAGFFPVFDAAGTPALSAVRTLWPAPHRFVLPGGLHSFGYAESVVYPLESVIGAPSSAGGITLEVRADYLVCEIECVPYRYDLSVEQALAPSGAAVVEDPEAARRIEAWRARVPRAVAAGQGQPTWAVVEGAAGAWILTIHTLEPAGDVFFDAHPLFAIGHPVAEGGLSGVQRGVFRSRLTPKDANAALPATSEFSWVVGALDARQTVELPSAGKGFGAGWPVVAAALVVALALVVIYLGRKIP